MTGTVFRTGNWEGFDEQSWTNPGSALTDFTGLIDVSTLSATWKASVQADGADIRITKGDNTELAYDLIDWSYNAGAPTGWIRFLWSGDLEASGTQSVRVWAGYTGTATAYDAGETYGSDNAYDSHWATYHPSGGTGDRTANGHDGTAEGGVTSGGAMGKVGSATTYDGSDDTVDLGAPFSYPCTAMLWFKASATPFASTFTLANPGPNGQYFQMGQLNTRFFMKVGNSSNIISGSGTTVSTGVWYHQAQTWDGNNGEQFRNGASLLTTAAGDVAFGGNLAIGSNNIGDGEWQGDIDDVQFHTTIRSDEWIAQEYAQSNDQASFWGTWAWSDSITITSVNTNFDEDDIFSLSSALGLTEGDLVLGAMSKDGADDVNSWVAPWSYITGVQPGTTELRAFSHVAGASPHPATWTSGDFGGAEPWCTAYASFSGVDSIQVTQAQQDTSAEAVGITFTSVDVTTDGSYLVAFTSQDGGAGVWSAPDETWFPLFTGLNEGGASLYGFYKEVNAGATGALTFTVNNSEETCGILHVLTPVADGGGATTYNDTLSESVTGAESNTATATANATLSESVTGAESNAAAATYSASISESITAADTVAGERVTTETLTESVTAAESNASVATLVPALSESITAAESSAAANTLAATTSDSVTAAESLANGLAFEASASESITAAESNALAATFAASVTESVTGAESNAATLTAGASISDSVTVAEANAGANTIGASLTESVTAAESATSEVSTGAQTYNETILESVTASEAQAAANTMAATVAESATAAESQTTGLVIPVSLAESVTAADSLIGANVMATAIAEGLTGAESSAVTQTLATILSEAITAAESIAASAQYSSGITESLTADDSVTGIIERGSGAYTVGIPAESRTATPRTAGRTASPAETRIAAASTAARTSSPSSSRTATAKL